MRVCIYYTERDLDQRKYEELLSRPLKHYFPL